MMTPNSDSKVGARAAPLIITEGIMKSVDSAVITSQRVFTERERFPPRRFRPRNEKSELSSSDWSENAGSVSQSCSIKVVFDRDTRIVSLSFVSERIFETRGAAIIQ